MQVVYGIAPSALIGPSTIGGAINLRTLEPTAKAHGLVRTSAGTHESFGQTLQATGSADRLGYVLSLHQAHAANQVTHAVVTNAQGESQTVGSDVDGQTALGKLRYAFGRSRDGYAEVVARDQSVVRDLSAALTSVAGNGEHTPSVGSRLQGHNAGYAFDIQIPLGSHSIDESAKTTALYRHLTSYATQSVQGPATGISTSYFNDRDRIEDNTLELDRAFGKASFALKYGLRTERLDTFNPSLAGNTKEQNHRVRPLLAASVRKNGEAVAALATTVHGLAQTQRSVALRLVYDPSEQLHYAVAAYDSSFSTFGHSFDPRLGIVWTPSARTAIRASAGTTFQSPQLTALYVPSTLPAPDANGRISIGNAHLRADHATEYDLGFEELLGGKRHPVHLNADFYRTNLRTPSQRLIPVATCPPGEPNLSCASYPINIGCAVYSGAELRVERPFNGGTTLRVAYGINSAYPVNVPAEVQNGAMVVHEQFLGVPLHKVTFEIDHRPPVGFSYDAAFLYEGRYNELNRAPFATMRGSIGYAIGELEFNASGTNLTNAYATRFTQAGAGIPYGGTHGPVATDAYALPGRFITFSLARRF